jgi:hypothetical protein
VVRIDWTAVVEKARRMTDGELKYAIGDAYEAARALQGAEVKGKDAGYYSDEASVYVAELSSRKAIGPCSKCGR